MLTSSTVEAEVTENARPLCTERGRHLWRREMIIPGFQDNTIGFLGTPAEYFR
jgi:hypothetical protein